MDKLRGVRRKNIFKIIETLLHHVTCTKDELKSYTGLSLSTIDSLLEELMKTNFVIKAGYRESTGGRPSMSYKVDGNFSQTFCIFMYRHNKCITLIGRFYDLYDEVIEEHQEVVSKPLVESLINFIDRWLRDEVHTICIALPGIVIDSTMRDTTLSGFDIHDLDKQLKQHFRQRIILENDVNMGVVGEYIKNIQCDSIALLFQPQQNIPSGIGIVINGKLIEGKSHIAGETRFMPLIEHDDLKTMKKTIRGRSRLLLIELQNIIAMLNPEAIVICASGVDDLYIEEELKKVFNVNDLPELFYVDDFIDEVLLGLQSKCKEGLVDKFEIKRNIN